VFFESHFILSLKKIVLLPRLKSTKGQYLKRMNIEDIDDFELGHSYTRVDHYNEKQTQALAGFYSSIITELGEDVTREGLEKTPVRVAKAMQFLLHGYDVNPSELIKSAMFKEEYKQMVIVKDIELYSLCEHHMLPFHGKAHVAYIPNGYITGLSKVARVVEAFARRLQVQERLTTQIRDCIQDTLNPLGVAVVIEAQHMCMQMRGIQKQNSVTTTSAFTGAFLKDTTRQEFIHLIGTKLR
jgi:GTP cyclohydrolase IA